tara:strand:- start:1300 stop:2022 length:723 start_codon:yes stop_codon:yes gene_type:complete
MQSDLEKKLFSMKLVDIKKEFAKISKDLKGYSKLNKKDLIALALKFPDKFAHLVSDDKQPSEPEDDDEVDADEVEAFKNLVNEFLKKPTKSLLKDIDAQYELVDEIPEAMATQIDQAIEQFSNKVKQDKDRRSAADEKKKKDNLKEKNDKRKVKDTPRVDPVKLADFKKAASAFVDNPSEILFNKLTTMRNKNKNFINLLPIKLYNKLMDAIEKYSFGSIPSHVLEIEEPKGKKVKKVKK